MPEFYNSTNAEPPDVEPEVETWECPNCSRDYDLDDWQYNERRYVRRHGDMCGSCFESEFFTCPDCGTDLHVDDGRYDEYTDYTLCFECFDMRMDERRMDSDEDEEILDVFDFTPRKFGRMRGEMVTSVELEFTQDPSPLARRLYNKGLAPTREVDSYSASGDGAATVKTDGSIDYGGELVISKLRLPLVRETNRLWACVNELRELVHNNENGLDTQCGCHIHVDATGLNMDDVVSSVVVFGFLEDVLYRIGAANYPRGHRSLNGNSYSNLTPKNPQKDPERFRASFGDRYLGLNVSNWIQGRYHCQCGVGFAAGDRCTCTQNRKNTLEFRLFNTTANPIKLHAYIALCQALVAYGKGKDLGMNDLPAMEFAHAASPSNSGYGAHEYAYRVNWMFRNLPLSMDERNSIRYCLRNAGFNGMLPAEMLEDETEAMILDSEWPEPVKRRKPRRLPQRNSRGQFATREQIRAERVERLYTNQSAYNDLMDSRFVVYDGLEYDLANYAYYRAGDWPTPMEAPDCDCLQCLSLYWQDRLHRLQSEQPVALDFSF